MQRNITHHGLKCLLAVVFFTAATNLPAKEICPLKNTSVADAIEASAKRYSTNSDGHMRLLGTVQVEKNTKRIRAERIDYNSKTQRLKASGDVRYTNCNIKNPTWFLSADQFILDPNRGIGTAKNAWIVIGNTPLIYLPRYRIPLENKRSSGFLTPDISNNSQSGTEISFPYYFNLAPNLDATIEPRILSKRGIQFAGKYRYLSRFHRGTIKGDWLNDSDYEKNDNRYSYSLDHLMKISDKLRTQIQVQRVSDENYIEDLSGSFDLTGENYLNSKMITDYVWRGWHLNFVTESFQRADNDAERESNLYERKPSVSLSKNLYSPYFNLNVDLRSEWVNFSRKYPTSNADPNTENTYNNTEGKRFDNEIVLSQPYRRPGFHFTPSLAMRYTDYNLDNLPNKSRTLPWFSLRTGLIFEKGIYQNRYRNTIEPELFYLNVPRRNQNDFPVFDTRLSEFRFSQLFEKNRYNGADRIGDADQLTLALSSRFLHLDSGKEALRFSVGHTSYFRDRKVSLADEDTKTSRYSYSDLASEFLINLNEKIKFTSSLIWNTEEEQPDRYSTRLILNASDRKLINLSHHYQRGEQGFNQSEISFGMPVGTSWNWFGGWRYDLRAHENISLMAGLRYETCCWELSLTGQRWLQDVNGVDKSIANGSLDYNTTIGIGFKLRGLGSVGINNENYLPKEWTSGYLK